MVEDRKSKPAVSFCCFSIKHAGQGVFGSLIGSLSGRIGVIDVKLANGLFQISQSALYPADQIVCFAAQVKVGRPEIHFTGHGKVAEVKEFERKAIEQWDT